MASCSTNYNNRKSFLIKKKKLLTLKDYLRDDLSSCSSNGFKSFPRRQCCTTIRFLLDSDLNNSSTTKHRSKSVLQKASEAFISALKLLPFLSSSSVKSPSPSRSRKKAGGIIILRPRSLSRRLFKRRKVDPKDRRESGEIRGWRLFLDQRDKPSDSAVSTAFTTSRRSTTSWSSISNNSWAEGEFTGQGRNLESYSRLPAGKGEKDSKVSEGVAVSVGDHSSITSKTDWPNKEDKEQFSPVSVLDCPFQDEEEIESPLQNSLVRMEGAKKKLMTKIRTFEKFDKLGPINLEKKMELAELEDESHQYSIQAWSMSNDVKKERDAQELLKLVNATISSHYRLISKADSILLDFFKEKSAENNEKECKELEQDQLEVARDWIDGHPQEMFLGWEVKDCRHVYIKDMEKNGNWRNFDEEKQELAVELEMKVFASLVNQALIDLLS